MIDARHPTFGIYQIHYKPELRRFLDPAFIPYENFGNERPEWREFHVFRKEWLAGTMDRHAYTGFFSWKFRQKARIEGQALLDFARANPGADCYFINPFPDKIARFPSVWHQGEHSHPGLIEAAEAIFRKVGYRPRLADAVHTSDVICCCNFWFATPAFWKAYMGFCLPVYDYIENEAAEQEKAILWASADRVSKAPLVPFIFERLFTEFLMTESGFDARAFHYSAEHLKKRFHMRFTEINQGSEALKRALRRNPDADIADGMRDIHRAVSFLYKPRKKLRRAKTGLRDAWTKLSGKPPWVLRP